MTGLEKIKVDLKPIKDEKQYRDYLKVIDSLIDCREDSPEEEALELVSVLVEDYERKI